MTQTTTLRRNSSRSPAPSLARAHADLTQEELATGMGTSQSAIARLESGRSRPSTTKLAKLAAATGTKLRMSFVPDDKAA